MKNFSKTEAILLSIIFFILLVFTFFILLLFFFGNNLYTVGRLPSLILLFISGYLTKIFYDKTRVK